MSSLRLLLRLLLGGLFVVLSLDKIRYPLVFAEALSDYDLLPAILIPVLAVVVPWVELFSGLFLILGILSRGASLLLAGLSATFTGIIGITLLRGLDIDCGCFTHQTLARVSPFHFIFDLALLLVALSLYRWGPGPLSLDLLMVGRHDDSLSEATSAVPDSCA